jgi:hypothetical protein
MTGRYLATKRSLMRLVLLGLAELLNVPRRAFAVDKLSKKDAEYQESPKGIQMCATCTLFAAPGSCKVVEGDISPNGWCKVYAMAD